MHAEIELKRRLFAVQKTTKQIEMATAIYPKKSSDFLPSVGLSSSYVFCSVIQ
ncbi:MULTISPECIES: hypothetical protein [Pseudomonas]|jgi:hypothetical protein|uniref:hypothetical protein n=1 Tax=Pseudomonas sp. TaxID=306 RepID=UPI00147D2F74|nr:MULTISPECIES: hypothetical protein [Pseudomonas]